MTLGELVETCGHIGLIEATVRGTIRSETERVCEYRIGARAEYYPGDYHRGTNGKPDATVFVIQKPIHVRDAGAASYEFGQVMKNIPAKLRNLTVTLWSCCREYGAPWNRAGTDSLHLRCDLRADAATPAPVHITTKALTPDEEDADQLSIWP